MLYTLIIAYDGTDYYGWQEQKGQPTIAQTIQDTFHRVFGHEIAVVGASRTDAGVHALGQVARFHSPIAIDPVIVHRALSNALPRDIRIRSLDASAYRFHPHHDIDYKIYQYHVFLKRPLPFIARFGYYHPHALDEKKFVAALDLLVGEHDFWTFCSGDCINGTVCCVDDINVTNLRNYGCLRVSVRGRRFFYHMVRRLVGAAITIAASSKRHPEEITEALCVRTPRHFFPTAPARGLVLRKIIYTHPLFIE